MSAGAGAPDVDRAGEDHDQRASRPDRGQCLAEANRSGVHAARRGVQCPHDDRHMELGRGNQRRSGHASNARHGPGEQHGTRARGSTNKRIAKLEAKLEAQQRELERRPPL